MANSYIDLNKINTLLKEITDIKNCFNRDLEYSNEALSDMINVLGGSTKVSRSIGRFQSATIEEKKNIFNQLNKLEEFLIAKIESYSSINEDSSKVNGG